MSVHSEKPVTDRLLQISGEVKRIANSLAQLSARENLSQSEAVPATEERLQLAVEWVIRRRTERNHWFPHDLLADPVWDMLLDLFHAELTHRRVTVSSVCAASGVPATTGLRWLNHMEQRKLVMRHSDPFDGRRVFIALGSDVSLSLHKWFTDGFGKPSL